MKLEFNQVRPTGMHNQVYPDTFTAGDVSSMTPWARELEVFPIHGFVMSWF